MVSRDNVRISPSRQPADPSGTPADLRSTPADLRSTPADLSSTPPDLRSSPADHVPGSYQLQALRWWDIEQVVALEQQLFPTDSPWTAGMFWSELAYGHHYVVIKAADQVRGYAGLARSEDLAEVQTIGVDSSYQHRGMGRMLMNNLLAAAGSLPIMLEVRTDNDPAIALYESLGFKRVSLRRNYYQPSGADAFTMEKTV